MAYPEYPPEISRETLALITSMKVALQMASDAALLARVSSTEMARMLELNECSRQLEKARVAYFQVMRAINGGKADLHVVKQ